VHSVCQEVAAKDCKRLDCAADTELLQTHSMGTVPILTSAIPTVLFRHFQYRHVGLGLGLS